MTIRTEHSPASEIPGAAPAARARAQRAEFAKFCGVSVCFMAGFLLASAALNGAIGLYLHRTDHRGGLGPEVQMAIERVDKKSDAVRIIFLGDSVSRQLFKPNTEPGKEVRFLTSNQAITMAGQCYLAEGAMKRCPNITDVYLFYLPAAWRNDMPRDFTHDYFCGHFHTLAQVREVWNVKHDIELTVAHAGRWLWPNIMAANSLSRPAFALQPDAREVTDAKAGPAPTPPDPERLLTELSALMAPEPPDVPPEPPSRQAVILSPTSRYYLQKLRQDCADRGVRLHVLPCPVSNEKNHLEFIDHDHIYAGPIIGDIPADQLIDAVHFKNGKIGGKTYIEAARERMITLYGLNFLKR